ncbi:uncharacterized protein LOC110692892 isoform X1 [Chenopodium quinoa]|uniref:uncharacterized protein LOC110692892 isoform X1 n=1 Tax=Chenopodium quinoa TaxID=63459 RepID=UPI000B77A688|nr:uncharacterized protein LOC110692892 isoform X1 [Chenopodium quinoa]
MKKGREMGMMVGIVLLMSMQLYVPSLAQKECWQNIRTCLNDVETWDEFQEECCKIVFEEINSEKECFCSVKPNLDRNVSIAGAVSKILTVCDIASFDTICSDSDSSPITPDPPSTPDSITPAPQPSPPLEFEAVCWREIDHCIDRSHNRSELEPTLNPSSPAFNLTEFLCCPLMQQTARIDKECFCTIKPFLEENPDQITNTTLVMSACNIVTSITSLNNFCQGSSNPTTKALSLSNGEASSPNSAPIIRPSHDSMESLSKASIVITMNSSDASAPTKPPSSGNTEAEKSAANKISMIGSLSGLFVIFTYVLFH